MLRHTGGRVERLFGGGDAAEDDGANWSDWGWGSGARQDEDGLQIFQFGGEFRERHEPPHIHVSPPTPPPASLFECFVAQFLMLCFLVLK